MNRVSFKKSDEIRPHIENIFEKEKLKILSKLSHGEVHHIGSTSVSGLLTKGDLDINVRVEVDQYENAVAVLQEMYQVNQLENWAKDDYASFKGDVSGVDFGAQLTVKNAPHDFFILFRDTLRKNPELVVKYNDLKTHFEGKTMDEYRAEKEKFCRAVLAHKV